jgi:hypothetical protein
VFEAGSHESQVLSPKLLVVNSCNLNHKEHESWDLPLHTESQVFKSQVWHGCLHGNTFWRWGLGLVLRARSSKKLVPTLNTNPGNNFTQNNKDQTWMIINHVLMIYWGSKVGAFMSACRDLLTWVGLGTWDPIWIGPKWLGTWPNYVALRLFLVVGGGRTTMWVAV